MGTNILLGDNLTKCWEVTCDGVEIVDYKCLTLVFFVTMDFAIESYNLFYCFRQETMQLQKRHELNRSYGITRSNSTVTEIPDEEFKIFMAIARYRHEQKK